MNSSLKISSLGVMNLIWLFNHELHILFFIALRIIIQIFILDAVYCIDYQILFFNLENKPF